LSDDNFFDYATATAKGTKMPRDDKDTIMQYAVPDLPLDIQIGIDEVLSAFDARIAYNMKINQGSP
jgi:type I restriction enzyme S subunit